MNETTLNNLKSAYNEYLSKLSIGCLRSVGRNCGVAQSTLKKKAELIGDIIAVLTGELAPIEKSNRGAPVKDGYVDPVIFGKLQEIKMTYLTNLPESAPGKAAESAPVRPNVLELRASDIPEETPAYYEQEVYVGQLETINGVSCLLPLNGRENSAEQIIGFRVHDQGLQAARGRCRILPRGTSSRDARGHGNSHRQRASRRYPPRIV